MLGNCKSLTHLDLGANLWTQPPRLYGGVGRVVRQAGKSTQKLSGFAEKVERCAAKIMTVAGIAAGSAGIAEER